MYRGRGESHKKEESFVCFGKKKKVTRAHEKARKSSKKEKMCVVMAGLLPCR